MDIDTKIRNAFSHLYPELKKEAIIVTTHDNETITVEPGDFPPQRAIIHSDDDGYLYFTPYDEDDEPEEDDHDFMTLRIRVF